MEGGGAPTDGAGEERHRLRGIDLHHAATIELRLRGRGRLAGEPAAGRERPDEDLLGAAAATLVVALAGVGCTPTRMGRAWRLGRCGEIWRRER
jgi:hypothetical protein